MFSVGWMDGFLWLEGIDKHIRYDALLLSSASSPFSL